ncbi:MAG TPA: translational GTPase TypA [Candidatus Saccharimonadia bacterium]|jgi:GTP-binding protein|nr:translational GTPase TypA [Candidatus Saccharimonadia bacterium]
MTPTLTETSKIRNVAIIAHVDHGKTTLVDGLLKQSHTFRDNQSEMQQTAILDTGDLERERGITISAKTIAVHHNGYKINIIDTPGHADFSGEVERTLNMADGCLLIVDAQEGPMPQTKFVLSRALALGLQPVVVVNKIDKRDQRAAEVVSEVEHLFLDLAISDDQLEFPVYYAIGRDGKSWDHEPDATEIEADADLTPIFDAIINDIPAPRVDADGTFQMLVTSLAWDSYQGKYAIGRVQRGSVRAATPLALIDREGNVSQARAEKLFVAKGLERAEVSEAVAGDIVWITGVANAKIGATVAAVENPEALPVMEIEAPTLQIQIGPNTSPMAGREGKFTTSRQIGARLERELETNVGLRVQDRGTDFLVSGRGELHLSVLIETLRREGFEMEVGRPQVVTKQENGRTMEPVEELTIEVPEEHVGAVTSELGRRRANLTVMEPTTKATTRLVFSLPTRALLGLRNVLLTATKGTATVNSLLTGYEPLGAPLQQLRNGVLIAAEAGAATTYSLETVEERGIAYIGPGTKVYEGMIIGLNRRGEDMEINVAKEKKLTNVRASSTDMKTQLTPFTQLSLEEALDFIENDELLEVTPQNLRMRKRFLTLTERKRNRVAH